MAEEKFLDILPPHKVDRESLKKIKLKRSGKLFLNKRIFFVLLLLLIFAGVFFHFYFQKAEIKVWPITETIEMEKEVMAKEGVAPNFASLLLPVQNLEIEGEKSQKFPASYVPQERKAEGIIRVYNNYSTSPLSLVAQTRFLSDSSKLFRAAEKILIPGKKLEGGKWLPGTIDVKVVAAQAGEDYNIGPSKFSLPGLAGTNLYTLVYGENLKPMSGGSLGKGYQVLVGDLETAEKILREKIQNENLAKLSQKANQTGQVLLENTASHQVVETFSSQEAGSPEEEFDFRVKLKTKALSFEKEILDRLAKELISSQISGEKTFWQESLKLNWQIKESNLEKKEILLALKISAKISDRIEKIALLDTLAGKTVSEALFLLKNQFEKVEIKTTPFWLRNIPKDSRKIKLEFIVAP